MKPRTSGDLFELSVVRAIEKLGAQAGDVFTTAKIKRLAKKGNVTPTVVDAIKMSFQNKCPKLFFLTDESIGQHGDPTDIIIDSIRYSIKYKSIEVKGFRPRGVVSHMGYDEQITTQYIKEYENIKEENLKKYKAAGFTLFSEIPEQDKLDMYETINTIVGKYLQEASIENMKSFYYFYWVLQISCY